LVGSIEQTYDPAMARPTDYERLQRAKLYGTASGILGEIRTADPVSRAKHQRDWPRLWERIDELVRLVEDRDDWTSDLR
jgi:hypothetical protein